MRYPEKYRQYEVKQTKVGPEVLAYSRKIFKHSILENPVFKDLAKFVTNHGTNYGAQYELIAASTISTLTLTAGERAERLIFDTYELVLQGEKQMIFDPKYKDVTLVVGNSGTGKSSLIQFLAGDISQLTAVKKGSGFVIEDKNDRISKKDNNFESKTLFPEFIINEKGDMAFYDCPGFKDNRGSAIAMASAHFTKLVFDNADKIKIHICVDHAVANGAERGQAFIEAIKHVGEFIKDADKFKICFSVTATKVPRTLIFDEEIGDEVPKTDDVEIEGIGETIITDSIPLLRTQLTRATDEKTKKILVNALTVFQALSVKENGKFTRIGLFRTPQTEGALSKSKVMIKSRATITSALEKKTEYVPVSKGDFNYTFDGDTKVQMLVVGQNLNINLKTAMDKIGVEAEKDCAERMLVSNNWRKTEAFLTDVKIKLDEYSVKLKTLKKLEKSFIFELSTSLMAVNLAISKGNLKYLDKQLGCLQFLNNMIEEISTNIPTTSLDEPYKFVTQAILWYKTLNGVYNVLSSESYQSNKERYNVANLDDWNTVTKNKGLRVSAATASRFFKLLGVDVAALGNFPLNEVRMNELNSVVHLTLVEKTDIRVTPAGVLLATGPFILLSHVVKEYKSKERQVKQVNILAFCVFYMDIDFIAPGRHMIICAPKWKVKNSYKISLDGNPGEDRSGSAEAGSGATPGFAGTPGGAGQAAGNFVGIADSIENAEFLTITANGGRGGKGQAGGTGGSAARGVDAIMPTDINNYRPPGHENVDYTHLKGWIHETDSTQTYHKDNMFWRIKGSRAKNGQCGGAGGAGGFGGPKGELLLTILSQTSSQYPKIRNIDGSEGDGGTGGDGGDGAKHGNDLQARYWHKIVWGAKSSGWDQEQVYDTGSSHSGPRGKSGGNTSGIEKKEEQISTTIMAVPLNIFKGEAIRFAANSPLRRADLEEMLARIDQTEKCNALYNIPAYLHEITTLENLYYSISKSIDTTPFYNSLLIRITAYADTHQSKTKKIERLALSTIYAACLSKLCFLDLGTRSQGVIVDLDAYMEVTLKRVEGLAKIDRRTAIKQFRDSYYESIELKVKEANQLMDSKVNPAIERIHHSMNEKLDGLVEEVIKKIEEATKKRAELTEQKKQMENALLIKTCLNVLKLGAMLVSFVGPIGAGVGGVVTAGATVGESFVVEPDSKPGDAILLPPGVTDGLNNLGNLVAETRAKKFKKFEEQLEMIQNELKDPPIDLQEVEKKIKSIRKRLDEEKAKAIPDGDEEAAMAKEKQVDKLKNEFKDVLKDKKTGLEEQVAKGEKSKKSILDKVKKLEEGVKLIEAMSDVYNKYKGYKKKLDIITESIAQADKAIQSLQQYESVIQSSMFPMVRKMREGVNKVLHSLSTKSQVALDVTQWEVQGTLRGVRKILEKAMAGFDAEAELSACFDSLIEAITLLMHIYDRLENFRDQQKLGDFIANIGAPGAYDDLLRETEYADDANALNMTIQSNLVLLEYDSVKNAFLQWVFPFAKIYFEKTNLPDSLKPVRNQETLKELVVVAKSQLESMRQDITKYWATIPNHIKFFAVGKFYLNDQLGGPFYMWQGSENRRAIKDIFNGEEVTLLADIRNNAQFVNINSDKNSAKRKAIKFSTVYLRFHLTKQNKETEGDEEAKIKNAKRQAQFEDLLEYFVVNMVHSGTNYYDFQSNFYVIYQDPVTFIYSIKANEEGVPDIKSFSRDKVMEGDLLLSPYTLWTIRLGADKKEAFENIKDFVSDISIELAGEGSYIFDEFDKLEKYHLEPNNYYQVDGKVHDAINS